MKLTKYHNSRGRSTCLYGPPKVGKTRIAGELAQFFNIVWFDLENGIGTVQSQVPEEWQERIEYIPIPDTKANPIAIDTMLKVFTGAPMMICEKHGAVGCAQCVKARLPQTRVCLNELNPKTDLVVIDSGSQLSDSAYNKLCGDDPYKKMEWDGWHNQNQLLAMVLSAAQQAHYNSLFITHEVEAENEDGTKQIFPLFSTRNFSSRSAKYFANVVYCQVKMGKYSHGATADFAMKCVLGNRAGLKLGEKSPIDGHVITLADLIINPEATSKDEASQALESQQTAAPEIHRQPESVKPPVNTEVKNGTRPLQVLGASAALQNALKKSPKPQSES